MRGHYMRLTMAAPFFCRYGRAICHFYTMCADYGRAIYVNCRLMETIGLQLAKRNQQ
jgi:hypothetical protein